MKPLEFMVEERHDEKNKEKYYAIIFFYDKGITKEIFTNDDDILDAVELKKHYAITDTYGYAVIDDRKGL